MTPYYEDGCVTIYHGDCREILPDIGTVDVLITDPPFGVNLSTKTTVARWKPLSQVERASVLYEDDREHVVALVSGFIPSALRSADRALIFPGPAMLWVYPEPDSIGCVFTPTGTGRCKWGFQCFHPVLFYGKDPFLVDGKGGRPNSFRTERRGEEFDHPCPKPLEWMTWAVDRASRPGELILDPFMGSGTTLVAAKNLARRAIGIEIEERYCEIAVKRLAQEMLPFNTHAEVDA